MSLIPEFLILHGDEMRVLNAKVVLERANVSFEVVPVLPNPAWFEPELATRSQDDAAEENRKRSRAMSHNDCRTQTGDIPADSIGCRLSEGNLRDPPTSESAEVNCYLLSGFHPNV